MRRIWTSASPLFLCVIVLTGWASKHVVAQERPNILWIFVDDQSRHYGFNGESLVDTPTMDRLAAESTVFTNTVVTAPVCSTSRSSLITGMYQTSIGAHHHRSGRGTEKIHLPDHVRMIPEYLQEAGYFTSLGTATTAASASPARRLGKSDYNFEWDESVYDSSDWSGREPGQPFFAQVMLLGGKARQQARKSKDIPHVAVDDVTLPPYYPDHPVIREDWAAYLDTFTLVDREVEAIVDRLAKDGDLQNTIIFFLTDHGVSHARGKQYCTDEGVMVPFFVYGPGRIDARIERDEMVAHIDVAASTLFFAGVTIPDHMEARPLFGPDASPREYVVSARDRCDETYDRIRSVRTQSMKYIRNGYPQRPHLLPNVYKDQKEIYQALREWHQAGKLNALQETLLFSETRPEEELYDLAKDPWELNNLADSAEYQSQLREMSGLLDQWIEETGDHGQEVEPMEMYDSDMAVYLQSMTNRKPERLPLIQKNIDQMKRWWREGK
ncbi:Arylsulfatase [Thalassoglobus neptunius]|uniref:Arylsulfatase n=1 Tax=Thalassoglobus neptunius TaxID=1938619 RepID=A0A5C5VXG7_9PLAN|nr:sulfatase [Thalassoglobus neptunius]TWT42827.1 Arylsulfatase [Thalassoglobus neptunius]